ncbi:MAG: potassium-transporting ATPase subunit KdpA [Gemmatimonadetes bacterium]|nr:potassium-transporting ATPase subunit KdpA [Gemmatimonadota bacterium]MBK7715171.1 potassium-transporting ATPase subunit KdpA [Gemmatimonadota bacterium]MBK7922714.1 potassium-transporting ATPase subunit KdpA [Gemmatimonadota bacterium]
MTTNALLQLALYLGVLLALVKPLGSYMARVYEGEPHPLGRLLAPAERLCYRLLGVQPHEEMTWQRYAAAVLLFSGVSFLAVYLLQRAQGALPLNPAGMPAVSPALAFNTAISFVSNTNWQAYGGEATLSYLTQMLGLTVQNFVSAAAGMAVLVALARGIARHETSQLGSFWADLVRGTVYILLPLSVVLALSLVSQGVVQSFAPYQSATLVEAMGPDTARVTTQVLPLGPAASQVAIKQLGTNGGGFFNVNSAHPFENPTPFSDFLQVLSILLIPAALCYTFGRLIRDPRQGWTLLAAMTLVFVVLLVPTVLAEQSSSPPLVALGADQGATPLQAGGNMEGKEVRFGVTGSALWAVATTAASNGSVNAMHDSFTPLGGLMPLLLMQLGEIIYGGVGSGLYGMLLFAIVTVFIAGLMVGRTPEYLGKKIEAYEMKMASLAILVPNLLVLACTAVAVATGAGRAGVFNPGPHGFSEVLYAFSSMSNNNGSAFGGLGAGSTFYTVLGGVAMWLGRFGVLVPTLAVAGSLARKKKVPVGVGTLPTHTPHFVLLLIGTIVLVGALTHLPGLALGPVVEHLQLHAR